MTYGLPYKGSKTKLAERIIDLMPRAEHLYDLFAGRRAMARWAFVKGKFPHVHINDMPQAFEKALQGEFYEVDRLISREDFLRMKNINTECLVTWSATDYQDVAIKENSVIYCDIPYKGTNRYAGKGADFDYDRFYKWALQQTQPLFISSYDMPKEDFKVIAEYSRTDTLSATNNSLRVTERIFIPRTQEYVKDNGLFGKIII